MRRRNIFLQWASCPILRFAPNVLPETAVPSARLEQDPHAVEAPLGGRVVQRVGRGEHGGGRIGLAGLLPGPRLSGPNAAALAAYLMASFAVRAYVHN